MECGCVLSLFPTLLFGFEAARKLATAAMGDSEWLLNPVATLCPVLRVRPALPPEVAQPRGGRCGPNRTTRGGGSCSSTAGPYHIIRVHPSTRFALCHGQ